MRGLYGKRDLKVIPRFIGLIKQREAIALVEKPIWWIFTFGQSREIYGDKAGHYVRFFGTYETARKQMIGKFGKKWAFNIPKENGKSFRKNMVMDWKQNISLTNQDWRKKMNSYKYAEQSDQARIDGLKEARNILKYVDKQDTVVEKWVMQAKLAMLIDILEVEE